jgi:hypothetical protein
VPCRDLFRVTLTGTVKCSLRQRRLSSDNADDKIGIGYAASPSDSRQITVVIAGMAEQAQDSQALTVLSGVNLRQPE